MTSQCFNTFLLLGDELLVAAAETESQPLSFTTNEYPAQSQVLESTAILEHQNACGDSHAIPITQQENACEDSEAAKFIQRLNSFGDIEGAASTEHAQTCGDTEPADVPAENLEQSTGVSWKSSALTIVVIFNISVFNQSLALIN